MSRKNNTFPKYLKLTIDPDNPPEDLWERGSRKCAKCGVQWPNYSIFHPSPCCNQSTYVQPGDPEMTWPTAVKRLLAARFERYYEQWNEDVTDEEIMWDDSIEDNFPIDEQALRQGMEEIDRLIGEECPKSSSET
jgi:hypothetical protein